MIDFKPVHISQQIEKFIQIEPKSTGLPQVEEASSTSVQVQTQSTTYLVRDVCLKFPGESMNECIYPRCAA